jgi:hypothetical protein
MYDDGKLHYMNRDRPEGVSNNEKENKWMADGNNMKQLFIGNTPIVILCREIARTTSHEERCPNKSKGTILIQSSRCAVRPEGNNIECGHARKSVKKWRPVDRPRVLSTHVFVYEIIEYPT